MSTAVADPFAGQLGAALLGRGAINRSQLEQAQDIHQRTGRALAETLLDIGAATPQQVGAALQQLFQVPYVNLTEVAPDQTAVSLLPEEFARQKSVIPIRRVGQRLEVALADPLDLDLLDEIALRTGCQVIPRLALPREILRSINQEYDARSRAGALIQQLEVGREPEPVLPENELSSQVSAAPLIRLVDSLLQGAIGARASDIHFEPQSDALRVRFRVDGVLTEQTTIPRHQQSAVLSRLKLMANMDIAETRRSQDGRIAYDDHGRPYDLRAATMPTMYGEKMVLRILDKSSILMPLERLGMGKEQEEAWNTLIHRPHGLILVVGPTGSGKTTTLYASLNTINRPALNIMTIEDPVEYFIPGINQTQVNTRAGITFASGLRSLVRQDPDVIMIGEIRDEETAEIAVQASLTGHLVISTIHTNSACGTVQRLGNMRVDPFLTASALAGVCSQRLVGRVCPHCSERYYPEPEVLERMNLTPEMVEGWNFQRGAGCRQCLNRGYLGRVGIYELLIANDTIRQAIMRGDSTQDLEKVGRQNGLRLLSEGAWELVKSGVTTIGEVARVVMFQESH